MRCRTLLLFAVFFLAGHGAAHAQKLRGGVAISTGVVNQGPLVQEQTHHVRFSQNGHDQYFMADLVMPLTERLGVDVKFMYTPSMLYLFPKTEGLGRFSYRPYGRPIECTPGAPNPYAGGCAYREEPMDVNCATMGLRYQVSKYIESSVGAGVCGYGHGSTWFGALPMVHETFRADVSAMFPIGEAGRAGFECGSHPAVLQQKDLTILRLVAMNNLPGDGQHMRSTVALPLHCGFRFQVN